MGEITYEYENHATLPEIAAIVAKAFPFLEGRAIAVSAEEIEDKNDVTLPIVVRGGCILRRDAGACQDGAVWLQRVRRRGQVKAARLRSRIWKRTFRRYTPQTRRLRKLRGDGGLAI